MRALPGDSQDMARQELSGQDSSSPYTNGASAQTTQADLPRKLPLVGKGVERLLCRHLRRASIAHTCLSPQVIAGKAHADGRFIVEWDGRIAGELADHALANLLD